VNDLLCRHRFGDSRSERCGKATFAGAVFEVVRSTSCVGVP
jgi:hypothetical protein